MCKLSLEEKIEIVHRCLLGEKSQREVAEAMGVKNSAVRILIRKAKANVRFLQELRAKEESKQEQEDAVVAETRCLLQQRQIINKASLVKHQVKEKHGLLVTD